MLSYVKTLRRCQNVAMMLRSYSKQSARDFRLIKKLLVTKESLEVSEEPPNPFFVSRFGDFENYAAKWQVKGDYYLGYQNLKNLHHTLATYERNRTRVEKGELLDELCTTFFARFHNMIREEYQFEKQTVEDRLQKWPLQRLVQEGFTLTHLQASRKGFLYQDKVFRFSLREGQQLPVNHRFSVGDTVRISPMSAKGSRQVSSKDDGRMGITGVVLERRAGFIEVGCAGDTFLDLQPSQSTSALYRLDAFVNRLTYDRMLQGLNFFLFNGEDAASRFLSRPLRDLLLYSYPSSVMRAMDSPGGLRLSLPPVSGGSVRVKDAEAGRLMNSLSRLTLRLTGSSLQSTATLTLDDISDSSIGVGGVSSVSEVLASLSGKSPAARRRNNNRIKSTISQKEEEGEAEVEVEAQAVPSPVAAVLDSNGLSLSSLELLEARLDQQQAALPTTRELLTLVEDENINSKDRETIFESNRRLQTMLYPPSPSTPRPLPSSLPFSRLEIESAVSSLPPAGCQETINESQREAIVTSLLRPLTLIQGPPGTGKTKTACTLLLALSQVYLRRSLAGGELAQGVKRQASLAAAHSNVAADNLLAGLITLLQMQTGKEWHPLMSPRMILRLGRVSVVSPGLREYTLEGRLLQDKGYVAAKEELDEAMAVLARMRADAANDDDSDDSDDRDDGNKWLQPEDSEKDTRNDSQQQQPSSIQSAQRAVTIAKNKLTIATSLATSSILQQTRIIVTTATSAGSDQLRSLLTDGGLRLSTVLIDEATQCSEAASFSCLTLGADRLILVGDQNQLPPTVLSSSALQAGMGLSLFNRLLCAGVDTIKLKQQYRMHPMIAAFPSRRFYDSWLRSDHVQEEDRPLPVGWRQMVDSLTDSHDGDGDGRDDTGDGRDDTGDGRDDTGDSRDDTGDGRDDTGDGRDDTGDSQQQDQPVLFVDVSPWAYLTTTTATTIIDQGSSGSYSDIEAAAVPVSGGFEQTGSSSSSSSSSSYSNEAEATYIISLIESLLSHGDLSLSDIGVISPYSGQVAMIANMAREKGWALSTNAIADEDSDEDSDQVNESMKKRAANRMENEEEEEEEAVEDILGSEDDSIVGPPLLSSSLAPSSLALSLSTKNMLRLLDDDDSNGSNRDKLQRQRQRLKQTTPATITTNGSDSKISQATSALPQQEPWLEIKTVDGFQGREKEIIFVSSVRSNRQSKLGFLTDWRRLNVAITRARRGLVIVGDTVTLQQGDEVWRDMIDDLQARGCLRRGQVGKEEAMRWLKGSAPSVGFVRDIDPDYDYYADGRNDGEDGEDHRSSGRRRTNGLSSSRSFNKS